MVNNGQIILLGLGAVAIAADILVRCVIAPDRKEKMLETLLDSLMEPDASGPIHAAHPAGEFPSAEAPSALAENGAAVQLPEPLAVCLLQYFAQAATSREVLRVLAGEADGMSDGLVAAAVNLRLTERGKPPLPRNVVNRVIKILAGSNLISRQGDRLALTELGEQLSVLVRKDRPPMDAKPCFASL